MVTGEGERKGSCFVSEWYDMMVIRDNVERSSGGKHCGVGGWRKRQVLSSVSESEIWNENLSISG
jgi:hypothetical protein